MDETDSDVEEYEEDVEEYKEEWVDEEDNDSEPLSPRSDDNYDNPSIEELIEELYTPILPCQEKRTESFGRDTSIRSVRVRYHLFSLFVDIPCFSLILFVVIPWCSLLLLLASILFFTDCSHSSLSSTLHYTRFPIHSYVQK